MADAPPVVDPPTPPATPPPAPPAPVVDGADGYKKLLEKHNNDALAVVDVLYKDNHKLRVKNRELLGKVPAEGMVTIAKEDASVLEALKALGKTPEEIGVILTEHADMKAADARRATETTRQEYADLTGFNPKVLGKLLDDANIEIEVQEPPGPQGGPQKGRDGKPFRVPMVKLEDPKDKRKALFVPLADYAAKNWPEFLPALKGTLTSGPARPNGTPPQRESQPPPAPPVAGAGRLYGGKNMF